MRSMTGFGRGEHSIDGFRVVVELKAVNRRSAEVFLKLPREQEFLENRIREEVLRSVGRGRVDVAISQFVETQRSIPRINHTIAASYVGDLKALCERLGLSGGVTLDVLIRCPGVLETTASEIDVDALWTVTGAALREALDALNAMRCAEGDALSVDLHGRIDLLREGSRKIRQLIPEAGQRLRDNLLQRIAAAGLTGIGAEDERVIREVVFYADRCDVTEELTRLESHFGQYDECRMSAEPIGRKLDFLAQEMNREINTIGSKSNDAAIAAEVIRLKTELERFREQVQNIE